MGDRPSTSTIRLSGVLSDPALARLLNTLGSFELPLLSLRQSNEHGLAGLSVLLGGTLSEDQSALLRAAADELGLSLTIRTGEPRSRAPCLRMTVLGTERTGVALAALLECTSQAGFIARETRPLGGRSFLGVDVLFEALDPAEIVDAVPAALRKTVLAKAASLGVDVALQKNDFFRTNRRLLCMDVDSTFVKGEFIDEMAALAGIKDRVAEITARAMRGELDFPSALRERVRLLKGLPMEKALALCDHFELTPGAEDLVRSLKRLGIRVGLVSGGFDFFVEKLKTRFDLDFAFANQLEVKDNHLTGEVIGTIVDGQRKAQVLRDMAKVYDLDLRQTIAAGDGANDMFMLEAAGLGIAYQAKPRLLEFADACFNHHDRLDTMLYLMGFDAPEVQKNSCSDLAS